MVADSARHAVLAPAADQRLAATAQREAVVAALRLVAALDLAQVQARRVVAHAAVVAHDHVRACARRDAVVACTADHDVADRGVAQADAVVAAH